MSLKDKICRFSEYFRRIEYQGGLLIISVVYPEKIVPQGSEDGTIKVTKSDDGTWYYWGDAEIVSEDMIFDLIENTVKIYEEAKQKVSLLRAKMEELKNIFATNSLDKLETLKFIFDTPTVTTLERPKRKYTKKPKVKEESKNEEVQNEEIIDAQTENE